MVSPITPQTRRRKAHPSSMWNAAGHPVCPRDPSLCLLGYRDRTMVCRNTFLKWLLPGWISEDKSLRAMEDASTAALAPGLPDPWNTGQEKHMMSCMLLGQ